LDADQQDYLSSRLQALPVEQRQDVLAEWSVRCAAGTVRDAAAYLFGLIRKARKMEDISPYIVPLSTQAMEVVLSLFRVRMPSQHYLLRNRGNPERDISESTLNAALKHMGYHNRLTVHGFRATF
jgi:hypothetical protein